MSLPIDADLGVNAGQRLIGCGQEVRFIYPNSNGLDV